jgi:hypothetical protein
MTHGKLLLWLTINGNTRAYMLTPLSADFGEGAYRLHKATQDGDGEVYDVCLNGRESTCECKGFLRHGRCKHVEALTALQVAGKLTTPKPEEEEIVEITEKPPQPENRCFECRRPCADFYCDKCGWL